MEEDGGDDEGEGEEEKKKKRQNLCRPNHFSKSSQQPLQRPRSFEFARSPASAILMSERTSEARIINMNFFIATGRGRARAAAAAVAAALAACVWRGKEPRTRDGTGSVQ